jgi:hypothetical protein
MLEYGKRNGHLKMETFEERINRIHKFDKEKNTEQKEATKQPADIAENTTSEDNILVTANTVKRINKQGENLRESNAQLNLKQELNNIFQKESGDKA